MFPMPIPVSDPLWVEVVKQVPALFVMGLLMWKLASVSARSAESVNATFAQAFKEREDHYLRAQEITARETGAGIDRLASAMVRLAEASERESHNRHETDVRMAQFLGEISGLLSEWKEELKRRERCRDEDDQGGRNGSGD